MCVNDGNYFIFVCLFKITLAIIASRKLVKMGRRICLFMYYAELISAEQWMVREGVALKGGLEHWTMEGKIRRGIQKQWGQVFLLT
jgi:hypothetical protein